MASSQPLKNQVFLGSFIHSKRLDELEYLHNAAVCVDKTGKIVAVERECGSPDGAAGQILSKLGWDASEAEVHKCREGEFFFPGFIDTHLHAPQYPNTGIFGKTTLLDWLNKYTFPMEASLCDDLAKARRVYTRCVRRTLSHGTTTAAYYATISVESTNLLADLCLALGQRALVGRVCMDRLGPDYYRDESAAEVEAKTRASIAHIRAIDPTYALVQPVLTPRFAPSCSPESMARLGALQRETGLAVQTHISENTGELALVRELFPDAAHYAGVYDDAGLLTDRTILAHAIHLSDAEADLIAARRAGVAHCPCSNSAITSGECRVRWLLGKGIAVGLGTDMSGGYSPSVLEAARLAVLVSRHLAMPGKTGGEADKLSVEEVLHLATRGGAAVVGLADKVGAFEVDMEFDAQLVGLGIVAEHAEEAGPSQESDDGPVDVFGWENWEERIAKWVYNGDDRNTKRVWVKGRLVHSRS